MKEYRESVPPSAFLRGAAATLHSSYAIFFPIYQWLMFHRKTN
jgi:hypothetical protein